VIDLNRDNHIVVQRQYGRLKNLYVVNPQAGTSIDLPISEFVYEEAFDGRPATAKFSVFGMRVVFEDV
jgi:hypothetical protein